MSATFCAFCGHPSSDHLGAIAVHGFPEEPTSCHGPDENGERLMCRCTAFVEPTDDWAWCSEASFIGRDDLGGEEVAWD